MKVFNKHIDISVTISQKYKPAKTMVQATDYQQHQSLATEEQSSHGQQPKLHVETWSPLSTGKTLNSYSTIEINKRNIFSKLHVEIHVISILDGEN